MPTSDKFKLLEERLGELKAHLLPQEFSETGVYTKQQLDMFKGYRLLVHAEFESYLEDIAKEVVFSSIRNWQNFKTPSQTMISFLAAYHSGWSVSDNNQNDELIALAKGRTNPKESLNEIIKIASTQFNKKVSSNNGIKAENFKVLILPTGLDIDELDPNLLTELDSFGSARGDLAHNSSHRVTIEINPEDELNKVNYILQCMRVLDQKLASLKSYGEGVNAVV